MKMSSNSLKRTRFNHLLLFNPTIDYATPSRIGYCSGWSFILLKVFQEYSFDAGFSIAFRRQTDDIPIGTTGHPSFMPFLFQNSNGIKCFSTVGYTDPTTLPIYDNTVVAGFSLTIDILPLIQSKKILPAQVLIDCCGDLNDVMYNRSKDEINNFYKR